MRTIDEFVKHINNGDKSFVIDNELLFICVPIGAAQFVYCNNFYGDIVSIDKLNLCAIVSDNRVFIIDTFYLDVWKSKQELPENVFLFDDAIKYYNQKANIYIEKYYNSLSVDISEYENNRSKNRSKYDLLEARRYILKEDGQPKMEMADVSKLTECDIKNIFAGFIDIETLILKYCENNKEHWEYIQKHRMVIDKLMNEPDTVKPFELEIAKAIKSVEAKTLKVEFEMNGKNAIGKIEPYRLMDILIKNDYFSGYDFYTRKEGDAILSKLGATSRAYETNHLTCQHITRITYGKKELYIRR